MIRWLSLLLLALFALFPASVRADPPCPPSGACPIDLDGGADDAATPQGTLLFFWGVGCPHCEAAKPFVATLEREFPKLTVERIEVKRDAKGRDRFIAEVRRLNIAAPGIPTFVYRDDYRVGYRGEETEREVRRMLQGETAGAAGGGMPVGIVDLPLVGVVDAHALPLPVFTMTIGLIDGVNPCAMWVLLVLLGILMHVKQRRRLWLFGGAFVLMSGIVYFLFMTVWIGLFQLVGLSRAITIGLGAVVLVMGLINLKELWWFKRGVSLMISDEAKPQLYARMRAIARAASLPAALAGIVALAFVVNLVELGCTLGLPAVYTRILALRAGLSPAMRYGYLALYNLAYVVPLAAIVAAFAATQRRITLSERGAKVLKAVSGSLLVLFGLVLIATPELLG